MAVQNSPTKACKRCKKVKAFSEYSKSGRREDGMQPWCKECVKLRDHERYAQDKNKHKSWNIKRRDRYYEQLTEYLQKNPCVDCGEADPIVLEFDHRDPTIKDGEVTKMIGVASWDVVAAEIAKCDVVCSNCHRKRTAKFFGWRRWNQQERQLDRQVLSDAELDRVVLTMDDEDTADDE